VLFSIQNETEWRMLCEQVLGRADVASDPRFDTNPKRVANRPALNAFIDDAFSSAPREDIIARLEAARIAYGRVSTLDDLKHHPQNHYVEVALPSGSARLLAPGMMFDGVLPELGPVPALGAHSEALRDEFAPRTGDAGGGS
jgi:crotonobetainyl-CoA:carnitine CoA-transferase CaiB-like acyl-CoA transferase